jgi:stage IV sporulation protein FB
MYRKDFLNIPEKILHAAAMFQFSLFRIPISIHWSFLLLAAFLGGALRAQSGDDWFRVFIFMIVAFHSILIHELGHAFAGLRAGAKQVAIQLHGMGGVAFFPGANFSRPKSFLVTAAGPAASLLLAVVAFLILQSSSAALDPSTRFGYFTGYLIATVVYLNVFWSIFNLFPVMPLDGGQLLNALLGPKNLRLTCIIGFITLALMAALLWWLTRSWFNMILILVIGSYTWRLWQSLPGK